MNDNHRLLTDPEDDTTAADALDAYLDDLQSAANIDLPAPAALDPAQSRLSAALLALAQNAHPDARFASDLEQQLTAAQPNKNTGPQTAARPAWAQRLLNPLGPRLGWSLAAAVVIVLVALLALDLRAAPTGSPTAPLAGMVSPASPQYTAAPTAPTLPADLPFLPSLGALSAQAHSNPPSNFLGWQPFPETSFTLQADLPAAPDALPVYRPRLAPPLDINAVRALADRFDLSGPIYLTRQWNRGGFPITTNAGSGDPVARGYVVASGGRRLTFHPLTGAFLYENQPAYGAGRDLSAAQAMPFEQAAQKAEAFLQGHGLLNGEYRLARPFAPSDTGLQIVQVVQVLDGHPVYEPFAEVTVAPDGRVAQLSYRYLSFEPGPAYPIQSAQQIWDKLASGKITGNFSFGVFTPTAHGPDRPAKLSWERPYQPGQKTSLWGFVEKLEPVVPADDVRYLLNGFELFGATGDLDAIAGVDSPQRFVRVWGQPADDGSDQFMVAGWEFVPGEMMPAWRGVIARHPDGVFLEQAVPFSEAGPSDEIGTQYRILAAPDDLPNGADVIAAGRIDDAESSSPAALDWATISLYFERGSGFGGGGGGGGGGGEEGAADGPPPTPDPSLPRPGDTIDGAVGLLSAILTRDNQGNDSLNVSICSADPHDPVTACTWGARLDGSGMAGIEQYDALHVRIWGAVREVDEYGMLVIDVSRYEKALPEERIQAWLGRMDIQTVAGQEMVVLRTMNAETFVLAGYPPKPAQADQQVFWDEMVQNVRNTPQGVLEGVVVPGARIGSYPVIRNLAWRDAPERTDLTGYQLEPRPAVMSAPTSPFGGEAIIDRVELTYMASLPNPGGEALFTVQPAWRFTGRTPAGDVLHIWVLAVLEQYLQ